MEQKNKHTSVRVVSIICLIPLLFLLYTFFDQLFFGTSEWSWVFAVFFIGTITLIYLMFIGLLLYIANKIDKKEPVKNIILPSIFAVSIIIIVVLTFMIMIAQG